jgi:hypothetical protein
LIWSARVFIGAIVRVAWMPDPKSFKLFAVGVLLYIVVKMVRDLVKKGSGNSGKTASEKRFEDMVRRHRGQAAAKIPQNETSKRSS